jgi:hypothetical protein
VRAETFRLVGAARSRGALRVPNPAFLIQQSFLRSRYSPRCTPLVLVSEVKRPPDQLTERARGIGNGWTSAGNAEAIRQE